MHKLSLILLTLSTLSAHAMDDISNFSSIKNVSAIEFGGYLMLDHDYYSPFYDKNSEAYQHATEIRRSKLGITFKPNEYFKGKFQIKYTKRFSEQGELALADAYMRIENNKNIGIQIGHMKEPFGLEQQTSSSELIAIERSLPTETFTPDRSYGLLINQIKKSYTLAAGYFITRNNHDEFSLANFDLLQKGDNSSDAITMRITAAPFRNKWQTLHIGSSASKRWLYENKIQYKSTAEVHNANRTVRSARFYADQSNLYQVEIAFHHQHWLLQSELFANNIKQVDGEHWEYSGAYIQASYKSTGKYAYKKGRFKSSKINNDTDLEWVLRYSHIDLRDNDVGNNSSAGLLGLNIHLSPNLKLMMNVNFSWATGDIINQYQEGRAYSIRAQLTF